ncbi:MAG: MBL fold metallo-hydrolase, partial [Candidatus Dormibacteria bacterium]
VEIGGLRVLTDPWFSERLFYHPGEARALSVGELPHLDAILVSHAHYDHCDLRALAAYPERSVPLLVAAPVVKRAKASGFSDVRPLDPWAVARVKDLTITAAPAKHGVYEVTFVISGGGRSLYFAGDTMLIPELRTLPERFDRFDVALLPTNGLRIRPQLNHQVVMDPEQAAELAGVLSPRFAVPQHYAFTGGWLGDRLITKANRDPQLFVTAARRLAPTTAVRVLAPGEPLQVGADPER